MTAFAEELRARVVEATGGLTASVGVGTSKFIAKVASDLDKPDGLVVVAPGTELDLLRPMHVTVIPGVGPATAERLRRAGIHTVADLERIERGRAGPARSARPAGTGSTTSRGPRTTVRWSPSGRPSRSASRAPTTPT